MMYQSEDMDISIIIMIIGIVSSLVKEEEESKKCGVLEKRKKNQELVSDCF